MLFSVEQAFVGRNEKRAPLKTPTWEATGYRARLSLHNGLLKVKNTLIQVHTCNDAYMYCPLSN